MKLTKSYEKLKKLDVVGIVLRPSSPEIKESYLKTKSYFEEFNIKVLLENSSAQMIEETNGIDFDEMCQKSDFLVSIGGDGTLISVVRRGFVYGKPVLGIHLGTLGFLTNLKIDDLKSFLKELFADNYRIDHRMMIKGEANLKSFFAFNDIVIRSKSVSNMLKVEAKIDDKPFNSYYGDGVIISTPTGSTAYNLSVGGPVVFPLTEAFIVAPISAHSLTQRPIVLPSSFEIEFKITDSSGATVIVDGQDIYEVEEGQSIKIKTSESKAKLLHKHTRNYFEVLSEKLNWGN